MPSLVSQIPAASAVEAEAHFAAKLRFETDCSDVFASQQQQTLDFVLVDVRGEHAYASGHVPGAINIPHRTMNRERMQHYASDTLFVVYCAGPHCNGADRAAMKLATLGFPVKMMLGGVTGWLDEGLTLNQESTAERSAAIACEC